MKLRFQSALFFTTVLLGAIACLNGCATTGIDGIKTDLAQGETKTGCATGCDLQAPGKTRTGQ